MKKKTTRRGKLMRALHAYIGKIYGAAKAHSVLKELSAAYFGTGSMSELTEKQLSYLWSEVYVKDASIKKNGIERMPQMTEKQKSLVRNIQKELGWSDEYMYEITIRRYGVMDWEYLAGRKAFAFINYLIKRNREKQKHHKVHK